MAAAIAAGVLFLALIVAGVMVFRITTDTGTIVIETNDPDVQVVVKQGGNQVTILDGKTNKQIELNSGEYEFQLVKGPDGLSLSTDRLTLKRGQTEIVRVRREVPVPTKPDTGVAATNPPPTKPDTGIATPKPPGPVVNTKLPEGAKSIINSIGMKLVLIPAGKFTMGSPKDEVSRGANEEEHEVAITKPFYLGTYTVTQAEYRKVMGKNPSCFSAGGGGKDKVAGMATGRFPVEAGLLE